MKKAYYITIELLYFFLLSVPLAVSVYVLLHVGLLFYVIYKQIKSLCQRITTK
jgi:hypothetical protein